MYFPGHYEMASRLKGSRMKPAPPKLNSGGDFNCSHVGTDTPVRGWPILCAFCKGWGHSQTRQAAARAAAPLLRHPRVERGKRVDKLRYMHRNPVKDGLVQAPEQWAWSSYCSYA